MTDSFVDANVADECFSEKQGRHFMQCWSSQKNYKPLPVKKTEGCWTETKDDRRIYGLRSAHECINLGFRHPRVMKAMQEQMEKVVRVELYCKYSSGNNR